MGGGAVAGRVGSPLFIIKIVAACSLCEIKALRGFVGYKYYK